MSNCPKCGKPSKAGDQACAYCGFLLSPSSKGLDTGTVLQSRYRIESLLQEGDTIYTFLARDERLDRHCIVRQIRKHLESETDRRRLEEEAVHLVGLSHPNIAMVFDYFFEDDFFFLVTEFVSGKTLREIFIERNRRLTEKEVVKWATSICDAVGYIHKQGIIHGLISPDAVMITEDGFIKLTSPGEFSSISIRKHDEKSLRRFGPPEQRYGNPVPQSDIFAIGATVYYLLTGFFPQPDQSGHEFPPIRQKDSTISSKLEVVLEKALRLEAARRYVSAQEFGKALKEAFEELKAPKPQRERPGDIEAVRSKEQIAVTTDTPSSNRAWVITLILSLMLGFLGADRFYLRQYRWGVWKLLTLGGFGWWWLGDLVYVGVRRRNFSVAIRNELPHRKYSKRIAICSTVLPVVLFVAFHITLGSFKVYGSSMLPTIEEGDYIFVNKAAYFFDAPRHGDIIVFKSPIDPNIDAICRIVALPGDTVEVIDDRVLINDIPLVEPYILEPPHYLVLPEEIPTEHYFVLGDNRNNSSDSHRGWTVPRENIVGRVWITYWPPYRWGTVKNYDVPTIGQVALNTTLTEVSPVTINDDFSNAYSGWGTGSDDWRKFAYEGGEYSISIERTNWFGYHLNSVSGMQGDFTVEVDAKKLLQKTDDAAGIVFRDQRGQGKDSFYIFWVDSSSGTYAIQKYIKDVWAPDLKDFTPSNFINRGANTNRLKVICKGSQIAVYANDYKLTTVTDTSLTSGYIGLAAETLTSSNAHYHFDNFKLYSSD